MSQAELSQRAFAAKAAAETAHATGVGVFMQALRYPEVVKRTGLSRASIYRLEAQGQFPRRFRLGLNSVAWSAGEVDEWLQARAATRDERRA